jgi:AmmeMemoRadiSam system protein A
MHPYCALAKAAVERYVESGLLLEPAIPLPQDLARPAACFVSIHKQSGELRGCIGTVQPTESDLAHEVIRNAIAAASRDPRFAPVSSNELGGLVYSVDILGDPELVGSMAELNPKQFGVLVISGIKRGLLLPDLEGVDSAGIQVAIAMEKGRISATEPYQVYRFRVERFH